MKLAYMHTKMPQSIEPCCRGELAGGSGSTTHASCSACDIVTPCLLFISSMRYLLMAAVYTCPESPKESLYMMRFCWISTITSVQWLSEIFTGKNTLSSWKISNFFAHLNNKFKSQIIIIISNLINTS